MANYHMGRIENTGFFFITSGAYFKEVTGYSKEHDTISRKDDYKLRVSLIYKSTTLDEFLAYHDKKGEECTYASP